MAPKEITPRSEKMMVPPLADVVWVDSRWAPSAQTRHVSTTITCTWCADCHETRAVRKVSVV